MNSTREIFITRVAYLPILGNWLAEDIGWNEYLVTGINMLLNVTTEFLYQKHVVYRHNLDTAA